MSAAARHLLQAHRRGARQPPLRAAVRSATTGFSGRDGRALRRSPRWTPCATTRAPCARTPSRGSTTTSREFDARRARGGHVHSAATAEEAVRIVVDIAAEHGVKTVVKGKSMVSEEIELNDALESAGIEVVETDLGEYIVQLDRRPSLAHRDADHPQDRHDVARLFREKLARHRRGGGRSAADDGAGAPACCARGSCRRTWASPAATSASPRRAASASCTNEGNGRLTTSVPRVHVALMGIERLVPTLDDLGVMLQVLGRSATGQKLTVYSNIMSGPRRSRAATEAGESDGPEHFHVVLVDNGRSTLVGSELAEILYCIRCGACLNSCPVYQQLGGHAYGSVYPGPVGAVLMPALQGLHEWHDLPQASSLCGACREVCPVRIDIPRMLLEHRDTTTRLGLTPTWVTFGLTVFRQVATRPALFRRAQALARLGDAAAGHRRLDQVAAGPHGALVEEAGLPGVSAEDVPAAVGGA